MNTKETGDHLLATTRKVIQQGCVNFGENLREYEVHDIISPGEVNDMLRPFSYVGFTSEVHELLRRSFGGPADMVALKYPDASFASSCSVLERLAELRELKLV